MKKVDVFNHIWPTQYYEKVQQVAPHLKDMGNRVKSVPMITDLDERFRVMDMFDDYNQILYCPRHLWKFWVNPMMLTILRELAMMRMQSWCRNIPIDFPVLLLHYP